MSRGDLQEMEHPKTTCEREQHKPAESMPKMADPGTQCFGSVEDLGGPTPENYKPDDDSGQSQRSSRSQPSRM